MLIHEKRINAKVQILSALIIMKLSTKASDIKSPCHDLSLTFSSIFFFHSYCTVKKLFDFATEHRNKGNQFML